MLLAAGLVATWAWYFAFDRAIALGSHTETFIIAPRPIAVVWLLAAAVSGLVALRVRGAGGEGRRFAVLQLPWLLLAVPFLLLLPGGMTLDSARVSAWRILPGILLVIALTSSIRAAWPCLPGLASRVRPGWRLWAAFFLMVHLPALWFVKPWMPPYYQRREIGGDEPEILLLAHSMAIDFDFNLYDNRLKDDRNRYISTSDYSMDGTAEELAKQAAAWGAGAPHTTAEYWQERRYNMYRPGLGLALAPGYRLGLKWGKHQRYGVVFMLSLVLTASMANMYLLARRATGSGGAGLLAALTAGLSGPLMYYGVAAYPDPIDAALLIFAVRKLYDFYRDRPEGKTNSAWAHAGFALAVSYMPWVHEKMIGVAVMLLAAYFILARPAWRKLAPVFALAACTILLQMSYYWTVYGRLGPVYVHAEPFRAAYLREGVLGLLLDRERGIMDVAPWFIAGLFGLLLWLRREGGFAWLPVLLATAFWVTTSSFGGWYAGACPQPRYLTNIMPFFGVGLALAWRHLEGRGLRAFLAALCCVGILHGVAGVLVPEKLGGRGPSSMGELFPAIRDESEAARLLVVLWVAVLLWFCGLLAARRPRAGYAALAVPLAAAVLWGSWAQQDRAVCTSIHGRLTGRLLAALRGPGPFDNSFNRRIQMHRWLGTYYRELSSVVPEVVSRVQAEDVPGELATVVKDRAASGGECVRRCGGRGDPGRVMGGALLTMSDGSFRADFALRAPGRAAREAEVIAAVARRADLSQVVAERRLPVRELPEGWGAVAVRFRLPSPSRFMGFLVRVEGDACIEADFVDVSYLPACAR